MPILAHRPRAALLAAALLAAALLAAPAVAHAQFPKGQIARTPTEVPGVTDARDVAVGHGARYVLKRDGTVVAWGYNRHGQLGDGRAARQEPDAKGRLNDVHETEPRQVVGITDAVAIAAGGRHALVVTRDGSVWAWGDNGSGQLGTGKKGAGSRVPVKVPGIANAVAVSAMDDASYAVLKDGRVLAWGDRLWFDAQGSRQAFATPTPVPGITDAVDVKAGSPTLALIRGGTVMAWGRGYLGEGSMEQQEYASVKVAQPARVSGIDDAVEIAAGSDESAVVRRDGTVWMWGGVDRASLGLPPASEKGGVRTPAKVSGVANVAYVSIGAARLAILRDGTLRTWGDNRLGALGRASGGAGPAPVPGLSGLTRAASANFTNMAVTRDGRAWVWGHALLGR
jgi:hypothetical protein